MNNPPRKFVKLRTYEDYHQSYVELADFPHHNSEGCVRKTIRIHNLIENYDGPGIGIDFDENNRAIGIEILYSYGDDENLSS